jgi:hypothetical protein
MAWLIGAIATYGIVVLLIGIAVMVYLFGDHATELEAIEDQRDRRSRGKYPRVLAGARQGAAPGTRISGAR